MWVTHVGACGSGARLAMAAISGVEPSRPSELARVEDRISFVYLEHAVIARDANALTATTDEGIMHIPSAGLLVLLLGPGTNVTHQAMTVLADSGAAIVWVGERGVRYYAGGRPLARSSRLLLKQASIVSNGRRRLALARRMYEMRFEGEDTRALTMQQLRGREGARIRNVYRDWSKRTAVEWDKRDYNPDDFAGGDPINQALSAANACLYGVVHAAVVAIGCSPGLGIVHTGHDLSFVYDIADLYKAEFSIPVAFEIVSSIEKGEIERENADLPQLVRREMRDRIRESRLIERIVRDVKGLLEKDELEGEVESGEDRHRLWDPKGDVEAGANYGGEARWLS